MNLQQNINLSNYSTMGLGGIAAYLVEVNSKLEVKEAHEYAKANSLPVIMIGGGSNIIWKDEGFGGLVIVNKIKGYTVYEMDETNVYITVGSGEVWDDVVARTVENGLTGIEALSLIPGSAGATPVQNVGAYGQEISQTLATIEAYDTTINNFVTIPPGGCAFGYRTSRFKTSEKGRFYITSLTLNLVKGNPRPPFYVTLASYLEAHQITEFTPQVIRDAVIDIRYHKLPDPNIVHNVGSFFGNPIVSEYQYEQYSRDYDVVPHWSVGEGNVKLSAAWLIEQAGFKDFKDPRTGMATWANQPLVLVNENATSTASLLAFRERIVEAVKQKFNVTLTQEPELLP